MSRKLAGDSCSSLAGSDHPLLRQESTAAERSLDGPFAVLPVPGFDLTKSVIEKVCMGAGFESVSCAMGVEGLLRNSQMNKKKTATSGGGVEAGQEIKVRVLLVDSEKGRSSLSAMDA